MSRNNNIGCKKDISANESAVIVKEFNIVLCPECFQNTSIKDYYEQDVTDEELYRYAAHYIVAQQVKMLEKTKCGNRIF